VEWWLVLIVIFGALLVFFSTGLPIGISFLCLDVIALLWFYGIKGVTLLPSSIYESVANLNLTPVPLFILLGEILFRSGSIDICYTALDKWVTGIKARLHIVTLIFAVIFGAISGSGLATCSILGTMALPEMLRRGYDKKLSLGVCIAGSTIDPLIPPSVFSVLIASMANESVAKLLISGIGPGLLLAVLYFIYIIVLIKIRPELAPSYGVSSSFQEKMVALLRLLPFGIVIFLVLGLMLLGIATPTESAATGVLGAFAVAAIYGRLTLPVMKEVLFSTVKITGAIFIIVAGAKAFSQIMAISGGVHGLVNSVKSFSWDPTLLLAVMLIIPLILGCFIDPMSIMIIAIPIYVPILEVAGFNTLWFWCLFLINMTLGGITPPFGLALFVLRSVTKETSLEEIYRAIIPFLILALIGMLIVILIPDIAVWLPNHVAVKRY
jgi:tripartite ATP-independent transporter DctM subunit